MRPATGIRTKVGRGNQRGCIQPHRAQGATSLSTTGPSRECPLTGGMVLDCDVTGAFHGTTLNRSDFSVRARGRLRAQLNRTRLPRDGSLRPAMEAMKSGKSKNSDDGVWQDRDIRFDTQLSQLEMHSGELQIDSINSVEDTKGNNGEKGSLSITNLRLIWICHRNSRINLSIGYNAVVSINIRTANSRLRGNTQAVPASGPAPAPTPAPALAQAPALASPQLAARQHTGSAHQARPSPYSGTVRDV